MESTCRALRCFLFALLFLSCSQVSGHRQPMQFIRGLFSVGIRLAQSSDMIYGAVRTGNFTLMYIHGSPYSFEEFSSQFGVAQENALPSRAIRAATLELLLILKGENAKAEGGTKEGLRRPPSADHRFGWDRILLSHELFVSPLFLDDLVLKSSRSS
ncbi:hypothetical protein C8R44DRAFT_931036 [Mycena epipterygia]|nr:hypothetical protein C8R44DRAFT_931036 [Mycena epipterygia]